MSSAGGICTDGYPLRHRHRQPHRHRHRHRMRTAPTLTWAGVPVDNLVDEVPAVLGYVRDGSPMRQCADLRTILKTSTYRR